MKRSAACIVLIAIGLANVGCATSTGPTTVAVGPGRYAQAFSITKDEIRRLGFQLARVDARSGVITSQTQSTAGLATPWTHTEASFDDRVDSFFHRDQRRISISFDVADEAHAGKPDDEPAGSDQVESTAELGAGETGLIEVGPVEIDRRSWEGELVCTVSVAHERLHRSGLRLSPAGILLSNVTTTGDDPESGPPVPIVREMEMDTHLASKLARMIRDRLGVEHEESAAPKESEQPKENDTPGESNP